MQTIGVCGRVPCDMWRYRRSLALRGCCILLVALCGFGCGGKRPARWNANSRGKYYVVQSGDTIWKIARKWRVPVQEIAEWNNIQDTDKIFPGRKIYLPGARKERRAGNNRARAAAGDEPIRLYHGRFQWPVRGPIHGGFGVRGERRHDGIDIGAPSGTPIHAAADGIVAYNNTLAGYGHLLILRHPDQLYTAYAHNARNAVKVGESVKQGQVIAYVGATGRATGPHLHFEVRHGQQARNPLFFLPVNTAEIAQLREHAGSPMGGTSERADRPSKQPPKERKKTHRR